MTLTRTRFGWRLETDAAEIDLTAEQAHELARRILGMPTIQRYGPVPVGR